MENGKDSRVLLILNPVAGHKAARVLLYPLVKLVCANEGMATVYATSARGEAERIARSGKLPDRESALLSPASRSSASMRAGPSPNAATAGASSTSTGTSAPAAARTSWTAGTSPSSATSTFDVRGASGKIGRRLSKDK